MQKEKLPSLGVALIPLLVLLTVAAFSIFSWKVGMFVPLISGIVATACVGKYLGYRWDELEKALSEGVMSALPAVFILFIIGIIIGVWILSGIIPALIYYGLALINPQLFVPLVALITGIISLVLGSSFTSIATVGIAFMAIGKSMGFPLPLIAGAVISGAFFGDKLSPLSDTTNVAPAMVGENLFAHVRHMLWDTIPAFILSLFLYWWVGRHYVAQTASIEEIQRVMEGLQTLFVIHPLLLSVPLITLVLMLKQYPAIPTLFIIALLGAGAALIAQGSQVGEVMKAATSGFNAKSEIQAIDSLLSNGGIQSMLSTIGLVITATALGGIMAATGIFTAIVNTIVRRIHSTGSLILATILSTFIVAFASGAQFLAIILPARGFLETYQKFNLSALNLSRSVEAAGTVGITLVPWSVPAVFAASVLGVAPIEFIPYIFFAILVPLFNVLYGYTGFSIKKAENYPQDHTSINAPIYSSSKEGSKMDSKGEHKQTAKA